MLPTAADRDIVGLLIGPRPLAGQDEQHQDRWFRCLREEAHPFLLMHKKRGIDGNSSPVIFFFGPYSQKDVPRVGIARCVAYDARRCWLRCEYLIVHLDHDSTPECAGRTPSRKLCQLCGKVNRNIVPPPGLSSASNLPPCASTITRQTDRPIPRPLDLLVTNGSNNFSRTADDSPGPVSATLISTILSGAKAAVIVSIRRALFAIASIALRTRLNTTCSICTRSKNAIEAAGVHWISIVAASTSPPTSANLTASRNISVTLSICFSDSRRAMKSRKPRIRLLARVTCSAALSKIGFCFAFSES